MEFLAALHRWGTSRIRAAPSELALFRTFIATLEVTRRLTPLRVQWLVVIEHPKSMLPKLTELLPMAARVLVGSLSEGILASILPTCPKDLTDTARTMQTTDSTTSRTRTRTLQASTVATLFMPTRALLSATTRWEFISSIKITPKQI